MNTRTPVVIVGGGVIGLFTAYELLAAGETAIVVDCGSVGGEASWAGGGILSPLFPWRYGGAITGLAKWGHENYPSLCTDLYRRTGVDPECLASGMLVLDVNEVEAEAWAFQHNVELRRLTGADVGVIEPALRPAYRNTVLFPAIAQVRNPRLIKALKIDLHSRGVRFIERTPVTGFSINNGALNAVRTVSANMPTARCVVATGAWTVEVLASIGGDLPLRPVKGQMLLLKDQSSPIRGIILAQDVYLIPRSDGHILVGSTVEECGFDKSITAEARNYLLRKAIELVPALAQARVIHQWAGLRPGSPDSIPFIGEHPRVRGLFVNAGHHRNGIVTAPASARLLVDLMLGRMPILPPSPYAVP